MAERYEVVVVGAGMGGLTAALSLARAGRSVLVLEQRDRPGGLAQSFTFDGGVFSPGMHYLGAARDGLARRILEGLGVAARLTVFELDPDAYDRIWIGTDVFDVPAGLDAYVARLGDAFPLERLGIERYFDTITEVAEAVSWMGSRFDLPRLARALLRSPRLLRWGGRTLAPLLDHTIEAPLLRAILSARCGSHGLPPSRVSLPVHAATVASFLDGGMYPRGGGGAIADALVRELVAFGGVIRLRTPVRRILLDRGEALGVELESGERIYARDVVSDLDPSKTFTTLIDPERTREGRRKAPLYEASVGVVGLCATLDTDPRDLGLGPHNVWWYRHDDLEAIHRDMARALPPGRVDGLFLSSGSVKGATSGAHTLEMLTLAPYTPFAPWAHLPEGRRGPDYERLTDFLGSAMLAAADEVVPGLRDAVRRYVVTTPLTYERVAGVHRGGIFGTAKTRRQVGPFGFGLRTSVRHLLTVGASTVGFGVVGAALSGIAAARVLLGAESDDEVLGRGGEPLVVHPPPYAPTTEVAGEPTPLPFLATPG